MSISQIDFRSRYRREFFFDFEDLKLSEKAISTAIHNFYEEKNLVCLFIFSKLRAFKNTFEIKYIVLNFSVFVPCLTRLRFCKNVNKSAGTSPSPSLR